MINIEDAYKTAKKEAKGFDLGKVRDSGDMWIFCFYKRDERGYLYPQAPNITVNKKTGETNNLAIPPLENLHFINSAKIVDFEV